MGDIANLNSTYPSPEENEVQYDDKYNDTLGLSDETDYFAVVDIFGLFFCTIGLVGNGAVICLLGFHIKRSPFTTFILNLAVADFGVLLSFALRCIAIKKRDYSFFEHSVLAFMLMHSTSQLLLTAISIDRCVSVFFPIWHRCHRPPQLSTIVCALIWILYCLLSGSLALLHNFGQYHFDVFHCQFTSAAIFCLPLVTAFTMILWFKVSCKPQQPRRRRLLTIILLALLFFLIFAFPMNVIFAINFFAYREDVYLSYYGVLCALLNSCVNPVIYFMVGRKKRAQQRQSLKVMLQRAFREEEEHREKWGATAQTSLRHLQRESHLGVVVKSGGL